MFKGLILALGFILALGVVSMDGLSPFGIRSVHAAGDNMGQVRLILKKLSTSMASMKDLDELEDAGMDKEDVDRMRRAMDRKIKQMTGDAVELIRTL